MIDKIYLDKLQSAYMTILDKTEVDIKKRGRKRIKTNLVKMFCYYARYKITDKLNQQVFTYQYIGEFLNRDHATVLYNCSQHENLCLGDKMYKKQSEELFEILKGIESEEIEIVYKRRLEFLNNSGTEELRKDWIDLILAHENHRKNIHLIRKLLETANE